MNNNFVNQLTLIKVFQFVFVVVTVFENLLTRPSQFVNKMRGRVSGFIILPLPTHNTRTDY